MAKQYDTLGHPIVPDMDERIQKLEQELAGVKKDIEEITQFLKHAGYPNVWGTNDRT